MKQYSLREAAKVHKVGHVAFWRACKLADAMTVTIGGARVISEAEAKRVMNYIGSRVESL